jgi:hypothetical protein
MEQIACWLRPRLDQRNFKAPFGSKELQRKIGGTENGGKEVCMTVWNGGIGSSFPLEYCASALIS